MLIFFKVKIQKTINNRQSIFNKIGKTVKQTNKKCGNMI